MSSYESLKKNYEFKEVYENGKSFANKYLVMYVLKNELGKNRVGISVSKKVGNSVVRHRVTRLIRESYRLHQELLFQGFDIIIIARVNAKDRNYTEINSALLHLSKIHRLVKEMISV